ncbi:MAG: (2Fe-2S)-binding protein [Planctomycetota bacterium]|nr:(2Fe-2S)-binding protein [Planctomycetota bacterium]MDA1251165.1 (2Fe-2S)-binding protein [Planctomycetota bacterium]
MSSDAFSKLDASCSPPETDNVVCHCLQIRRSEIKTAASMRESATVRCVMKMTDAGTGCTACHSRIRQLLAEYARETKAASPQLEQA